MHMKWSQLVYLKSLCWILEVSITCQSYPPRDSLDTVHGLERGWDFLFALVMCCCDLISVVLQGSSRINFPSVQWTWFPLIVMSHGCHTHMIGPTNLSLTSGDFVAQNILFRVVGLKRMA